MPKVLFLHKGAHAASTRYRALQYFNGLREAGWTPSELKVSGSVSNYAAALRAAREADVVVVLKKPFKAIFRRLLRRAAKKLVFDFDDAVYVRDSGAESPRRQKQFQSMLKLCDDTWAGNTELQKVAGPLASRSCLIPTTLDCDRYQLPANKPSGTDLVWIGGRASRPWLESLLPTLELAASHIPGLRLNIVADFSLESKVLEIVEVPWSEQTEVRSLVDAHIGIAPLPDNAFTRGKCGLKILQYMAAGLPVVASPTGMQRDAVANGASGILADAGQEWVDALSKLSSDPGLQQSMGEAGRLRCQQHYSIAAGCEKIVARLNALQAWPRESA